MDSTDRQERLGSTPALTPLGRHRKTILLLAGTVNVALVWATVAPAVSQTHSGAATDRISLRTADLVALRDHCGGADPRQESYQLVQRRACPVPRVDDKATLAFEENRLFIYALMDTSSGLTARDGRRSPRAPRRIRRFFLLKPSTFVVEDLVRVPSDQEPIRWVLQSSVEPQISESEIRTAHGSDELVGVTLLPANAEVKRITMTRDDKPQSEYGVAIAPQRASDDVRFLHVFHVHSSAEQGSVSRSEMVQGDRQLGLTVTTDQRVFRLTLPSRSSRAGTIEVAAADGEVLLPRRLLPSSVMPHGPEGARLLERWDAPYRNDRRPGWDVGRPSSHLVKAVEEGTLKPGRAIVFGCGSGTNAIYLASQGFEVTGVDVAPTALTVARQKARQAGVTVRWMMADVLTLPELEPFDVVFDRGCYHHVRQYDAAGYVETVRRLSRPGSRLLLLAGSAKQEGQGGPPRIKDEEIRSDFKQPFEFEWFREVRFDSTNPDTEGPLAWSVLVHRRENQ